VDCPHNFRVPGREAMGREGEAPHIDKKFQSKGARRRGRGLRAGRGVDRECLEAEGGGGGPGARSDKLGKGRFS